MADTNDGDVTEGLAHEADGVVIIHYPSDGSERYGIGPFPPIDDLLTMLAKDQKCDCRIEQLWVAFPRGISMVVVPPREAMEAIEALINEAVNGPDRPRDTDRLN